MAPTTKLYMPVDTALTLAISRLQQNGSPITDFNTLSVARTLLEAVAVVASANSATADQLQLDSYLDTATGAALDALGSSNWLVDRNAAVQGTGQITIVRQDTTGALLLPAGFTQLATTPAVPGDTGVPVLTTQDASFAVGQASVTVSAQAVIGGQAGNLSAGVYLVPLQPVSTISNQTGYQVTTAFTNGVDAESDDKYRARIPLTVQGRSAKGRMPTFLAAALGIPGVLSTQVLTPGQSRGDGSVVPAGTVEIYYQGAASLLAAVQAVVESAATASQTPLAIAAVSLANPQGQKRIGAQVTVYTVAGTDTTALAVAVSSALQTYVNSVGLGGTLYVSQAIEAVLAVPGVISATIPPPQLNLFGTSGATDLTMTGDSYPSLAAADVTVVVNTL